MPFLWRVQKLQLNIDLPMICQWPCECVSKWGEIFKINFRIKTSNQKKTKKKNMNDNNLLYFNKNEK